MLNLMPEGDQNNSKAMPHNIGASNRKQERGGPNLPNPDARPGNIASQNLWTQMSINCLMNCGVFSSDQMLNALNERAFNLSQSAIIKQANAMD